MNTAGDSQPDQTASGNENGANNRDSQGRVRKFFQGIGKKVAKVFLPRTPKQRPRQPSPLRLPSPARPFNSQPGNIYNNPTTEYKAITTTEYKTDSTTEYTEDPTTERKIELFPANPNPTGRLAGGRSRSQSSSSSGISALFSRAHVKGRQLRLDPR